MTASSASPAADPAGAPRGGSDAGRRGTPAFRVAFRLERQDHHRACKHIDAWLHGALADDLLEAGYRLAPPRPALPAAAQDHAYRVFVLAALLLQAAPIPVIGEPSLLKVLPAREGPEAWRVLLDFPPLDFLPSLAYGRALQSALTLAAWMREHEPGQQQETAAFFGLIGERVLPRLAPFVIPGKSTVHLLRHARRQGIPHLHLGGGVFQLGWGAAAHRIDRSTSEMDSAMGCRLSLSKVHTARLLRMAGLPAPRHAVTHTREQAVAAAARIGWPVVVKPADCERGEGVTVDVEEESQLLRAFDTALELSRSRQVLVERQEPGLCHRVFVAHGSVLYAVKRLPLGVRGDGRSSVADLVEEACSLDRARPPWRRQKFQPLDPEAHAAIAAAGLRIDSVPATGAFVPLRRIESTALGGISEEVHDRMHPDNRRLALDAARLLGLAVAGIDIMSTDLSVAWHRNGAVINEVNFAPSIGGGEASRGHIPAYLHGLLQGKGRIPVEVFVGGEAAWSAAESRWRAWAAEGVAVHLTSATRTLDPAGQDLPLQAGTLFQRARALVLHPAVEALVLVVQDDGLLRTGLPLDAVDRLVRVEALAGRDGEDGGSLGGQPGLLESLLEGWPSRAG